MTAVKDGIKNTNAIVAAWQRAGCPEKGIVVDGYRHKVALFHKRVDIQSKHEVRPLDSA
jgi:hypothetical protein